MSVLVVQAFRPAVLLETLARGDVSHGKHEEREGDDDVQQVEHECCPFTVSTASRT
jgi:hypothetical protein